MYRTIIQQYANCSSPTVTRSQANKSAAAALAGLDAPVLKLLSVTSSSTGVFPPVNGIDESFRLSVPADGVTGATLTANTYSGVLRGLETFAQLVLVGALEPGRRRDPMCAPRATAPRCPSLSPRPHECHQCMGFIRTYWLTLEKRRHMQDPARSHTLPTPRG